MTSTHMSAISGALVPTSRPEEAWPMLRHPDDLQWLSIQQGPQLLLQTITQWREGSPVKSALTEFDGEEQAFHETKPGPEGVPKEFAELCEITAESDESNPYYAPLQHIAPILKLILSPDDTCESLRRRHDALINRSQAELGCSSLNFIGNIATSFIDLLRKRDARALLILSYWYALTYQLNLWPVMTRAKTECTAICIFLETSPDPRIREMLEFPAKMCGYTLLHELPLEGFNTIPPDGTCAPM